MKSSNYLQDVANQYEEYPYPERNPEDERKRLYPAICDCFDRLNYYCFEGKRDFRKKFRVLVAGGGTGDAAIFLAEQLRGYDAEIVYLDICKASMEVAKQRAAIRLLSNVTWIQGSLLDLPVLKLGLFDYINCSGVLHHLENPQQGLAALNAALKPDGAMAILVYAKYGRTAIYQIQELMRFINRDEKDMHIKVKNCEKILNSLPDSNWFAHSKRLFPNWGYRRPIELYDLFLHSQDRAYTVPELYEFIETEGLHILHLLPQSDPRGNNLYNPCSYLDDKNLINVVTNQCLKDQQAIAELLNGGIPIHLVYVAKEPRQLPSLENLENIPYLDIHSDSSGYSSLYSFVRKSRDNVELKLPFGKFSFRKTINSEGIFKYLDGNHSMEYIFRKVIASPKYRKGNPTRPSLKKEFKEIFEVFLVYDSMFLRDPTVPHPATVLELQQKMMSRSTV